MEVLATVIVLVVAVCVWKRWSRIDRKSISRMPPGPRGWPLFGNLLQLDLNNPLPQFAIWREKFGKIFKFNLMGQNCVVVSSPELLREVLITKQDEFSGRPDLVRLKPYFNYQESISTCSTSPTWRLSKKAQISSMKMYGNELLKLERVTLTCIQKTVAKMAGTRGEPFNPQPWVNELLFQILAILASGSEFSDADLKAMVAAIEKMEMKHNSQTGPGVELEMMPWLKHLGHPMWPDITQNAGSMWQRYYAMIRSRKAAMDEENPDCFLDGLIQYQRQEIQVHGEPKHFTDDVLGVILADIFIAGTLTTSSSTRILIAIMANHPEIQTRMQREIDEKIGEAEPRLKDKEEMPYTNAVILELLRYVQITPVLVPHMAVQDATLGGYFVPKNTRVLCNVFSVSHDPDYWEDPWTYNPDRFLDDEGQLVGPDHPNRKKLFSFGAGRRACPGEVLAKNRLFLIITSLFQAFRFLPTQGKMAPNHDPRTFLFAITCQIKDYEVIAKPRKVGEHAH